MHATCQHCLRGPLATAQVLFEHFCPFLRLMEASPLLDAELQAVEAAGLAADLLLEGGAVGDQLDDQASPWLLLGPRTSSPILPDPSAFSLSFRALMRIVMLKSGDGTTKPKPILLLRVSLCLKNHSGVSLARIVICSEHKTIFLFLLRDIATHLRLLSILFLRSPLYLCLGKTEFGVRFLVPAARESG